MTQKSVKIITALPPSFTEYSYDLWLHRHVLQALFQRDIKEQYVQTKFGLFLAIIKPAIIVFIFTILFYYLLNIDKFNYPYPLFVLSGILGWNFFTTITNHGSSAIKANIGLARKIGFPLLLLPMLSVGNAIIEWLITFLLLFLLMLAFGVFPTYTIVLIPTAIILNMLLGLGLVLWLNTLSVRNRDLLHIIPYFIGFAIWLSPVFFPVSIVPAQYLWLIDLNPITGLLSLYRYALFFDPLNITALLWSWFVGISLTFSGAYFFSRKESDMIDYL